MRRVTTNGESKPNETIMYGNGCVLDWIGLDLWYGQFRGFNLLLNAHCDIFFLKIFKMFKQIKLFFRLIFHSNGGFFMNIWFQLKFAYGEKLFAHFTEKKSLSLYFVNLWQIRYNSILRPKNWKMNLFQWTRKKALTLHGYWRRLLIGCCFINR